MGPNYLQEVEDHQRACEEREDWMEWLRFCQRQAAAGEMIITAVQGVPWQQTRDAYFGSKSYLQRPDAEWNF